AARSAGSRGWHRALGWLALVPIYEEFPVQLNGPYSVLVVLDNRSIWGAAGQELSELPIVLAIGILMALLAANSLKRHVVDPLKQLANTTRVGNWAPRSVQPAVGRRRHELTELATNFETLADRLADYERDFRNVRLASAQKIIERTK